MKDQIGNFVWAILMVAFALVIVYPTVEGFSNIANLLGVLWGFVVIGTNWYYLAESHTAEKDEDAEKRDKALALLREVDTKLQAISQTRNLVNGIQLAMLVALMTFTGSVMLALTYLTVRFLSSVAKHTGHRVVTEADAATTTPTATAAQ